MTRIRKRGQIINEDQDSRKRIYQLLIKDWRSNIVRKINSTNGMISVRQNNNIDADIVNLDHISTNANFLDRFLIGTSIKLLLIFSRYSLVRDVTINLECSLGGPGSM